MKRLSLGDLIKPNEPNTHAMTIVAIDPNARTVTGSYRDRLGVEQREEWLIELVTVIDL